MATWIVCMLVQKFVMGFATEVRARRFLEARQKPMKLLKKEKISPMPSTARLISCLSTLHDSVQSTTCAKLMLQALLNSIQMQFNALLLPRRYLCCAEVRSTSRLYGWHQPRTACESPRALAQQLLYQLLPGCCSSLNHLKPIPHDGIGSSINYLSGLCALLSCVVGLVPRSRRARVRTPCFLQREHM